MSKIESYISLFKTFIKIWWYNVNDLELDYQSYLQYRHLTLTLIWGYQIRCLINLSCCRKTEGTDMQSMVWFYLMIKINRSLSFSYGNIGSKTINHIDWSHMSILENYNSNKLTTKMKIVYNKAKWWFQANTDRLICLQWHEFFLLFWGFLFFLYNKNAHIIKINQRQVIIHITDKKIEINFNKHFTFIYFNHTF